MIDALLPWPPSANAIWRGKGKGMFLSQQYRDWMAEASHALRWQQMELPIQGPVEVRIQLSSPTKRPFDLDNRVKAILDLLVGMKLIEDDASTIVTKIIVERGTGFTGAWLYVIPASNEEGLHPVSEVEA